MQNIKEYIGALQQTIEIVEEEAIQEAIQMLHETRLQGRQVFIMGNGGSASTATHFVCDLSKNTRREELPHYRVIGLTDNMASFSAFANDEGYENVFKQQLASLVNPGDIVIGISASGNSPNVINAIALANEKGAKTIGFTGFSGGKLRPMVDLSLHVPSDCIEHVEDIHLMLEHLICYFLRQEVRQTLMEVAI